VEPRERSRRGLQHPSEFSTPFIHFEPGRLTITCRDLEHLVEQLVLVARSVDTDYETLKQRIGQPARKPPGSDLRRSSDPAEQPY
jgi:hypothetical protein